jgi:signal peptidase I
MRKKVLIGSLIATVFVVAVVGGLAIYGYRKVWMIRVPTGAMMNTILPGEGIIARRFSGEVRRGQILVFQYPGDKALYVGRVIGLPNETVEVRDTLVFIDGHQLDEERVMVAPETDVYIDGLREISTEGSGPYRVYYTGGSQGAERQQAQDTESVQRVPADSFFMLGDNRDNSQDSRYRGSIPRQLIWGEAWIIYDSYAVNSQRVRDDRTFKRIR